MLGFWIILAVVALFGWAWVSRWLLNNPRGDLETGLVLLLVRVYARVCHRLRVEGKENIPPSIRAGPLVVVVNHTAGVDPALVQAACRFEIRWVMAKDMRHPLGEVFWRWSKIVFVDRGGGEVNGTRAALRHVTEGGVLGIFPEGGLERPPRVIRPFHRGIGFIIRKTGARVLPVVIEGTPQIDPAWASLWCRSRSRVTFMPVIDYTGSKLRAGDIAEDLRRRYLEWTGWESSEVESAGRLRYAGNGSTNARDGVTPRVQKTPRSA